MTSWIYYFQIIISKIFDSVYHGIGNEPHRIENIDGDCPRQMKFNEEDFKPFLPSYYINGTNDTEKSENEWIIINPEILMRLKKNLIYTTPHKSFLSRISGDIKMIRKPPKQIVDNLWLGNAFDAANYNFIKQNSIKAIINITCEVPNFYINDGVQYLNIIVRDEKGAMINEDMFNESSIFIDNFIQSNEAVFVHCFVGRSRSVAIVCYYLIRYKHFTFKEAYNTIKKEREFAQLNSNFAEILSNYEST